eukprot:1196355-Rhodomonas_salina.2
MTINRAEQRAELNPTTSCTGPVTNDGTGRVCGGKIGLLWYCGWRCAPTVPLCTGGAGLSYGGGKSGKGVCGTETGGARTGVCGTERAWVRRLQASSQDEIFKSGCILRR